MTIFRVTLEVKFAKFVKCREPFINKTQYFVKKRLII